MAIEQISRVRVRSGLQQTLPILAKGELGWCVDTLRLFIGNGTVEDGAPFEGNTEILTSASAIAGGGIPPLTPVSGNIPVSGAYPLDGVNSTFVLPVTPYPATLLVWRNYPLALDPTGTTGYKTLTGFPNTVVFSTPPQPGDFLFFQCWVA